MNSIHSWYQRKYTTLILSPQRKKFSLITTCSKMLSIQTIIQQFGLTAFFTLVKQCWTFLAHGIRPPIGTWGWCYGCSLFAFWYSNWNGHQANTKEMVEWSARRSLLQSARSSSSSSRSLLCNLLVVVGLCSRNSITVVPLQPQTNQLWLIGKVAVKMPSLQKKSWMYNIWHIRSHDPQNNELHAFTGMEPLGFNPI